MSKHVWTPWLASVALRAENGPSDTVGKTAGARGSGSSAKCHHYTWQPTVDLFESHSAVVVRVDLPGVDTAAVALEIHESGLVIHGERPCEQEAEQGVYQMLERAHGPFHRTVPLPDGLELERASAVLRDGLLTITIPKAQPQGRRRIPVSG